MCGKHFGLERSLKSHKHDCQGIRGPNYGKNLKQQMDEPEMEEPETEEPEMEEPEMTNQGFKCKVCDEDFESERGHRLHMRLYH